MEATFWIETIEYDIEVPALELGQSLRITPVKTEDGGQLVPEFVTPPLRVNPPRTIKVSAPQIQYAQQVFLNFNGLTWPHVSVATLVPGRPRPGVGVRLDLTTSPYSGVPSVRSGGPPRTWEMPGDHQETELNYNPSPQQYDYSK